MKKSDILGRWSMRKWEQRYDDGRVLYPMGENLIGFIQYDDDDRMVAMIAHGERPNFVTGGQWNASETEKAGAYDTFLAYAGAYDIEGDTVRHHVDISLFPNWKGGIQARRGSFVGGQLYLSARIEDGTAQARTINVIFERG